ncbi:MAG: hypothetical protein ACTHKF_03540 [Candidatus Nitrosocosmicus sp.]
MGLLTSGPHRPIERDGKVVVAKIIVYAGEDEEYSDTSKEGSRCSSAMVKI